jgi:hypothetical protein
MVVQCNIFYLEAAAMPTNGLDTYGQIMLSSQGSINSSGTYSINHTLLKHQVSRDNPC